jgi:cell division protein DivIC
MRFLRIIFNKYLLTAVAFLVLMIFFDQNDWMSQKAKEKELSNVNDNIAFLQRQIDTMEHEYKAIHTDPAAFERYARETYRMKRDSEDLYIIETK